MKWVIRYVYNKLCKNIVCLTDGMKKDLVECFKIDSDKITVINNPIDICTIRKKAAENFDKEKRAAFTFLSVGRLIPVKDYDTLIEAYAILKDKISFHAWIVGKGDLKDYLQDKINDFDLQDNVELLGFDLNPYKYYIHSDIFVLSSKSEGFGLVLLEAMALDVPIVSTACDSGPKKVIEDGKNGKLVEVGNSVQMADAIYNLCLDEHTRETYKVNGMRTAQQYDLGKIAEQYLDVILENHRRKC